MADCAKEGNESKKAYSEHNLAMTGPVQLLRNARIVPQLEKQRSSEGGRGTHQQPNQASHAKPRKRSLATAACIIYWFPFNARHDLFYVSSWISRSGRTLFFYCFSHFVQTLRNDVYTSMGTHQQTPNRLQQQQQGSWLQQSLPYSTNLFCE